MLSLSNGQVFGKDEGRFWKTSSLVISGWQSYEHDTLSTCNELSFITCSQTIEHIPRAVRGCPSCIVKHGVYIPASSPGQSLPRLIALSILLHMFSEQVSISASTVCHSLLSQLDHQSLDSVLQLADRRHQIAALIRSDTGGNDSPAHTTSPTQRSLAVHVHIWHVLILSKER